MALSVQQIRGSQQEEVRRIEQIIDRWLVQTAMPKSSTHSEEKLGVEGHIGPAVQELLSQKFVTTGSGWSRMTFSINKAPQVCTTVVLVYS
ncbi:MAG: hypothetical protein WC794_00645 [Candidatus Doudnabacteria bacterium]|jgi:hypothetical protein